MAPMAEVMFPFHDRVTRNEALVEEYYSPGLRDRFRVDGLSLPVAKLPTPVAYADISYEVDEDKYLARAAARVRAGGLEASVPAGWPKAVTGPLVWDKDSFQHESQYIYYLTGADKAEIKTALEHFKSQLPNFSASVLGAFSVLYPRLST